MQLSEYLKRLREKARLSRADWAKQCGVSRMTVWRWETGKAVPHEHELQAALAVLNIALRERMTIYALRDEARFRNVRAAAPPPEAIIVHRGDLLRAIRGRMGWTQEETARRVGISRALLTRWERYEAWPASERIHALGFALGATEAELLALTRGINELPPLIATNDLDELQARSTALNRSFPSLAVFEPEIIAQIHHLAGLALNSPRAASLLHWWHLYYAQSLTANGRIAEGRSYLTRLDALPAPDEHFFLPLWGLQTMSYHASAAARKNSARLRAAGQRLLPLQEAALPFAARDDAQHARLLHEMALSMTWIGRNAEAVALTERALPLALRGEEILAFAMFYERGYVLQGAGRPDLVLDEFPRYLGRVPLADAFLHLHLGMASKSIGDSEGMIRHLESSRVVAERFHRVRVLQEIDELLAE